MSALDRVRRDNLAEVLGLVHRRGPLSRAELTTATGLNRSTVGVLVSELVGLGLVAEASPGATNRVGRPSPSVHPDPRAVALAVNPEVDAVTVGVVGLGARVESVVRHPVDRATPERTAAIVAAALAAPGLRERVVGVGLAVPGLVREADGVVRWAPHLGWRDAPLAALVADAAGVPAHVANDASLGALAEHLFGAGRDVDDLVYLNGGASGIGGGVIAGGRPLGGHGGYAGEFGQSTPAADPGDRVVPGGALEDEIGRARLLAAHDPAAEVARQHRVLAVALANIVDILNPRLVLLGGDLAALLARDPAGLERLVAERAVAPAWEGTRIAPAALGDDLLLVGAAELALAPLLADPGSIVSAWR